MHVTRTEKVYKKHAWIIFFAVGIIWLITGVAQFAGLLRAASEATGGPPAFETIAGIPWSQFAASNPGAVRFFEFAQRGGSPYLLFFGVFSMAVSLKSYRRGERWAWYASWMYPVVFGLFIVRDISFGGAGGNAQGPGFLFGTAAFILISLLGLFLPYRKFFPRK